MADSLGGFSFPKNQAQKTILNEKSVISLRHHVRMTFCLRANGLQPTEFGVAADTHEITVDYYSNEVI